MSGFERLTTQSEVFDGVTLKAFCESCGEDDCRAFCTNEGEETQCDICPVQKAFERLAQYEESGLSPDEVSDLAKVKIEGRLVILPSKSEEIIRIVELALRIKLYDWQKAYITGVSGYVMPGRVSGKTIAYMVRLCISEGEPIDLTKRKEIERYQDGSHGSQYSDWFKHELWRIYMSLERVGGLKLKKIYFSERDKHDRR